MIYLIVVIAAIRYTYLIYYVEGFTKLQKGKKAYLKLLIQFVATMLAVYVTRDERVEEIGLISSLFFYSGLLLVYYLNFKVTIRYMLCYITLIIITNIPVTFILFIISYIGTEGVIVFGDISEWMKVSYLLIGSLWSIIFLNIYPIREKLDYGKLEQQLFIFFGINLWVLQLAMWLLIEDAQITKMESLLVTGGLCALMFGYVAVFEVFCRHRRVNYLIKVFNLHRSIKPEIEDVIKNKNDKLEVYLGDIQQYIQSDDLDKLVRQVKRECFISVSFCDDDILNAILFNYYILLEERRISLITKVPGDIKGTSITNSKLYDVCIRSLEFVLDYSKYHGEMNQVKLIIENHFTRFYISVYTYCEDINLLLIEEVIEDMHYKLRKHDQVKNLKVNVINNVIEMKMEVR